MDFKIGDRVMVHNSRLYSRHNGWTGTVICTDGKIIKGSPIGVAHDKKDALLHEVDGLCPDGYGWWYCPSDLVVIDSSDLIKKGV